MSVCVCATVECEHPVGLVVFSKIVRQPLAIGGNALCCAAFTAVQIYLFYLHKDRRRGCCSEPGFCLKQFLQGLDCFYQHFASLLSFMTSPRQLGILSMSEIKTQDSSLDVTICMTFVLEEQRISYSD